jgi:methionyl-tRNA synthetase
LNLADFTARVNADLVGKFVNLASRCAGFIEKRFAGKLADELPDIAQYQRFVATLDGVRESYERNDPASAIRQIMALADEANKYIDDHKPWVIAKQEGADAQLQRVCTQGINLFRVLAAALKPILPRTCAQAEAFLSAPLAEWEELDDPLDHGHVIQPYSPLFTRIDPKLIDAMVEQSRDTLAAAKEPSAATQKPEKKKDEKPAVSTVTAAAAQPGLIGIEDFARLDLRIGKVLVCECVEGSDKLLRFELDAGELGKRQIFSGIRASYGEPEKLVGRNVVFIANLAPRKMRFGTSEGMILSAGFDGGALALLSADENAQPGMPVR